MQQRCHHASASARSPSWPPMPRPRLQRAATARREKVQLRIREQSFYPLPAAAQAAFVELRALLSQAPILKYFDPLHETELWTDASGTGIGGSVLQRDSRGSLRPVAYYSLRLSPSEEKYSTYQHELLAIRDCLSGSRSGFTWWSSLSCVRRITVPCSG